MPTMHYKCFGHTQEKSYSLIGFPEKSINMTHLPNNGKQPEPKNTKQNVLFNDLYKEFLQYKASLASFSATVAHTSNSISNLSLNPRLLVPGFWTLELPIM